MRLGYFDCGQMTSGMSVKEVQIQRFLGDTSQLTGDILAIEEPLEIRIAFGKGGQREEKALSITMRTPGSDEDLALGFLFTEGIINRRSDILSVKYPAAALRESSRENVILLELHPDLAFQPDRLSRHFYTSSSCGVCGKTSIELVQQTVCYFPKQGLPRVSQEVLTRLPGILVEAQPIFSQTGGIHAAGLFSPRGELILSREDVGRHNALDKLIGAALRKELVPLSEHILLVSGRASFELVQKSLMAGIPFLAAVGAPSSLAVELAEDYGMTLVGFLRANGFNLYGGGERLQM